MARSLSALWELTSDFWACNQRLVDQSRECIVSSQIQTDDLKGIVSRSRKLLVESRLWIGEYPVTAPIESLIR